MPDADTTPTETIVRGTTYAVVMVDTSSAPKHRESLVARGWDGETYLLTGKRGAQWMAYRAAATGEFELVHNLGRG